MEPQKNKFSDYVNEATKLWWDFVRFNNIAIDNKYSYTERRKAADSAEQLIKRRYEIIDELDSFFDKEKECQ